MIEIRGLAKYFGRFSVLRDLNLRIESGEFVALFGRNGAGKTTLLRILAGLGRPSAGSYSVAAPQDGSRPSARGRVGYLSHNTSLYLDLTAIENLRFYARLMDADLDNNALRERICQVGLAGREEDPVRTFSRGMQQRLAIARAFLHDPDLLLLDEPFTGLDCTGEGFLKDYLRNAHARGKTCVMALHDAPLGYSLADRMVVINRGVAALDVEKASISLEAFEEQYARILEDLGNLGRRVG